MKMSALKYLTMCLAFAILYSCQVAEVNNSVSEESTETEIDYLNIIESLGYPIDEAVEYDDFFVVSEETFFYKEQMDEFVKNNPQTKTNAIGKLPVDLQDIYITDYYISDNYVSLFKQAVAEWNSLSDCNIRFSSEFDDEPHSEWEQYVTLEISDNPQILSAGKAMIRETVSQFALLEASINTSHETWKKLGDEQRKYAIMHALGHLIGLKDADETLYKIQGTHTEYSHTIMRPSDEITDADLLNYWQGISDWDEDDLSNMYPLHVSSMALEPSASKFTFNKNYTLTASYVSKKTLKNAKYEFSVISMPEGASNPIQNFSSNVCTVRFDKAGMYRFKVVLSGGSDETQRFVLESTFAVSNDVLTCPSNIKLGSAFEVNWEYGDFSSETDIVMTGSESIFDKGSAQNVNIQTLSRGRYRVTLKQPGSYTLKLEAKRTDGSISKTRYIYIDKFYRPTMSFEPIVSEGEFDYRLEKTVIGNVCKENVDTLKFLSEKPYNTPYATTFSTSGSFTSRFYCKVYKKYLRETFPTYNRRVSRMPVTDTTRCDEILRYPGDPVTYTPNFRLCNKAISFHQPITFEGEITGYIRYQGYYTVVIPNDRFEIK